jgi:hypothetical protein
MALGTVLSRGKYFFVEKSKFKFVLFLQSAANMKSVDGCPMGEIQIKNASNSPKHYKTF